jgi:hypothetical protein
VPVEGHPDLGHPLGRQMPKVLDEAIPGYRPDLLTKSLAREIQSSLSKTRSAFEDTGIRVIVGLERFARSFCNTTAGRVLPTSDSTTGSSWTR